MFKKNMIYTAILKSENNMRYETFDASHSRHEAWSYATRNFSDEVVAVVTGNQEVFFSNGLESHSLNIGESNGKGRIN